MRMVTAALERPILSNLIERSVRNFSKRDHGRDQPKLILLVMAIW